MGDLETNEFDDLTDDERAFFASGGTKGLDAEADQEAVTAADQKLESGALDPAEAHVSDSGTDADTATAQPDAAPTDKDAVGTEKDAASADGDTPAGDESDDGEADAAQGKRGPIPWQKYDREQKKWKERIAALEKENNERQEKYARADERMRVLAGLFQADPQRQSNENPDPEPDPNEDIMGWVAWQKREMDRLKADVKQNASTTEQSINESRLLDAYRSDAAQFSQSTPDFGSAYQTLRTARAEQLRIMGHAPAEIGQMLYREERDLAAHALQSGQSPAALIYELAKSYGYRQAEAPHTNGNGHFAPEQKTGPAPNGGAAPATPVKSSAADEVARIAAAQTAGKSLSGTGGTGAVISPEAILNMDDAEFEAFYAKNKPLVESMLGKR